MNPSGIKFDKVYLDENGKPTGVMRSVVDGVLLLLDMIGTLSKSEEFTQAKVEEIFQNTAKQWEGTGVEIDEYRLMLVVQVNISVHC